MPKPPEACEDVNQAFAVEEDKGSCASIGLGCLIQGVARLRFFLCCHAWKLGRQVASLQGLGQVWGTSRDFFQGVKQLCP